MIKHLPNLLTLLRILLTPVFIFCILRPGLEIHAFAVFLFASVSDWFDGYLARKYQLFSEWGRFWDPLADKILVLSALLSFVYLGLVKLWMFSVILIRDFIVTGLRSYALTHGRPMVTNIFAKMKTASQLIMIGIILVFILFESLIQKVGTEINEWVFRTVDMIISYNIIYAGMFIVTLLTILSGFVYLYQNRNSISQLSLFSNFKHFL